MRHILVLASWVCLGSGTPGIVCAEASLEPAAEAPAASVILSNLLQWLPGNYTNAAALELPSMHNDGAPIDNDRLTTYIRSIDLPRFGENVLFLEEYRGAQARQLERIRLYVFEPDHAASVVGLRLLNPKDPEKLQGTHQDLSRLQALTLDDVTVDRSACTLAFTTMPSGIIVGRMSSGQCDRDSNWVDYELHVGPNAHWVCYTRRSILNDTITWQLVPPLPCVLMNRTD